MTGTGISGFNHNTRRWGEKTAKNNRQPLAPADSEIFFKKLAGLAALYRVYRLKHQKNTIGTGLVVLEIKRPVNAGSGSRGVVAFPCQAAVVFVVNP